MGKWWVGWLAVLQSVQEWSVCKELLCPVSCFVLESIPVRKYFFCWFFTQQSHSQWTLWREKQRCHQLFCIWIILKIPERITLRKGKILSRLFPSSLPSVGNQGPGRAIKQRNLAVWFKQLIWMWKARNKFSQMKIALYFVFESYSIIER